MPMIEMEGFKQQLSEVRALIAECGKSLDIEHLKEQLIEYQEDMASNGFWDDMEHAQKVNRKAHSVESKLTHFKSLNDRADDIEVMMELADAEDDHSMVPEIESEFAKLKEELQQLRLTTLLRDQYDTCDCILALHAGAGGTEAQDWTQMLYRMYNMWADRHGYTVKLMDYLDGDEAGIKSATIMIEGENAYGFLKSEHGIHRLVRISPFDSSGRRHTSFSAIEVMPEISDDNEIELRDEDIKMDVYRSSGAGGQKVNKTSSAVRLTHIPTGIVVSSQVERSHFQNLENCRNMLRARLAEIKEREHLEKISDIKGVQQKIEWGSQIRSYVFMPYTLAKDHRTGYENGNIQNVMDGDIDGFINAFLAMKAAT